MIGLTYNEYLQRFGASPDAMAAVLVEARKNGARIPWSYWHDRPLARQDYLDSPVLADPIRRLDCDIPVDGVAAFVLTSAERARDLPHRPVYISGYASGSPTRPRLPLHWPLDDLYETGGETARRLWEAAGSDPTTSTSPSSTTASPRLSTSGSRFSGSARSARLTSSYKMAASTATPLLGCRALRWGCLG